MFTAACTLHELARMVFRIDQALATSSPGFVLGDMTRFFPRIDRIFPGEALNPFFGAQDEGFSEFCSGFRR